MALIVLSTAAAFAPQMGLICATAGWRRGPVYRTIVRGRGQRGRVSRSRRRVLAVRIGQGRCSVLVSGAALATTAVISRKGGVLRSRESGYSKGRSPTASSSSWAGEGCRRKERRCGEIVCLTATASRAFQIPASFAFLASGRGPAVVVPRSAGPAVGGRESGVRPRGRVSTGRHPKGRGRVIYVPITGRQPRPVACRVDSRGRRRMAVLRYPSARQVAETRACRRRSLATTALRGRATTITIGAALIKGKGLTTAVPITGGSMARACGQEDASPAIIWRCGRMRVRGTKASGRANCIPMGLHGVVSALPSSV